jgi:hypothetical protein
MSSYVSAALRRLVIARADALCEYCLLHEDDAVFGCEVDHIIRFEFQRVSGLHWSKLFHQEPRGCLFDFAGIRAQKIAKLTQCFICAPCLGKLADQNVNQQVTTFASTLLGSDSTPIYYEGFARVRDGTWPELHIRRIRDRHGCKSILLYHHER